MSANSLAAPKRRLARSAMRIVADGSNRRDDHLQWVIAPGTGPGSNRHVHFQRASEDATGWHDADQSVCVTDGAGLADFEDDGHGRIARVGVSASTAGSRASWSQNRG